MHGVLGFLLGQKLIEIASAREFAGLYVGVRQQLIHFGEVRLVSRFFEQLDELFQGGWTAADRSDGGAQNFQDLGGIFSQEAVGMFFDDSECFFVATVLG